MDESTGTHQQRARLASHPLKKLYYWTLHWAETPYAIPALLLISFTESAFFIIPPTMFLIAMCLAAPRKWFQYTILCTLASIAGGVLGWYIGYALYETLGRNIIQSCQLQEAFDGVGRDYDSHAFFYIMMGAFTPIPYKVFTIAAGVFHEKVSFQSMLLASLLGRFAHFFVITAAVRIWGVRVKELLEKDFKLAIWGVLFFIVAFIIAFKWLF